MEALNEVDEPLNPYSRLFMLVWAVVMIVVAGFRPDTQTDLPTKRCPVNTRLEARALSHTMKMLVVSTPQQIHLSE